MNTTEVPDFAQLAYESPYTFEEWRTAWATLSRPNLWPTVLQLVLRTGHSPTSAASSLARAFPLTELVTDDELAQHPDQRIDPGVCGVTHQVGRFEFICIRPPHDPNTKNGNRGPANRDGYYPQAERHYMVNRWPNRET